MLPKRILDGRPRIVDGYCDFIVVKSTRDLESHGGGGLSCSITIVRTPSGAHYLYRGTSPELLVPGKAMLVIVRQAPSYFQLFAEYEILRIVSYECDEENRKVYMTAIGEIAKSYIYSFRRWKLGRHRLCEYLAPILGLPQNRNEEASGGN